MVLHEGRNYYSVFFADLKKTTMTELGIGKL